MKKIFVFAALAFVAVQSKAQDAVNLDTYIGAQLATEDLNGTARYVGMGGAMDALGADISTIGSNPAGIGLFRHSQVAGSFGLVSQSEGKSFADGSKTTPSFDQLGFVVSTRSGVHSFINFGFNFHKSRNFNHVLSAAARSVNGSSQNRQTYIKGVNGDLEQRYGVSMVDELCLKMMESGTDPETGNPMYNYINSDGYMFNRAQTGYIGEYDFNLNYMMLLSSGADAIGPLGLKGDLQEHYLNIPVRFDYGAELAPGVRGFVYAGPTLSFGLASSTKLTASIAGYSADKVFDNYSDGSDYGRMDVLLGGGIGVDVNKIRFTVGYDCGMLNRYTGDASNTARHRNQLTAGLALLF